MTTELWQRIKTARRDAKLTQDQVADTLGISRAAVAQWEATRPENRTAPSRDNLALFAKMANVSLGWLMDDSLSADPTRASVSVSPPATTADYVRVLQLDAEAGMGGERVNDDYPEVIRAMDFEPAYIRSVVGFVPPPGRLVLVTGRGDSMVPVILPGESLMVDTGVTAFDGDGVYLINIGGGHQVKGLQHRGDAIYVVSANTALYPAFPLPAETTVAGKVYLRNRIDRFN